MSSRNSIDLIAAEKDKDSETTKIDDKKVKAFDEFKNIFDNSVSSGDETVAYSPKNIKYCNFLFLF